MASFATLVLLIGIAAVADDAGPLYIERAAPPSPAEFRWERRVLPGDAELLTLFGGAQQPRRAVPMLSVLREPDQASSSERDHLRYVWVYGYTRPTWIQRLAAAAPFFYRRAQERQDIGPETPKPILDLKHPARGAWARLLGGGVQHWVLDGAGAPLRLVSRTYRGNAGDGRALHVDQALAALLEAAPRNGDVSDESTQALTARLALEGRPLGQFVSDSALPSVYQKERGRTALNLAHNWDLLRQSAEKNGLYFDPLASGGNAPAHAMLWISREELNRRAPHPFDAKLLNIEDPWRDEQLRDWRGYTEARYLDQAGVWNHDAEPGAQAVEMIPLALYSLDYPRTPLLLVDFRHRSGPKRHELLRRASSTVAGAVFGVTPWNSWAYFAGSTSWNFVTGRHGAAIDRGLRLRAYARCREYLLLDDSLGPQLRDELRGRLKTLEFNPLDNGSEHESEVAWQQYRALLLYAEDPGGLTHHTSGRSSAAPRADAASGF